MRRGEIYVYIINDMKNYSYKVCPLVVCVLYMLHVLQSNNLNHYTAGVVCNHLFAPGQRTDLIRGLEYGHFKMVLWKHCICVTALCSHDMILYCNTVKLLNYILNQV